MFFEFENLHEQKIVRRQEKAIFKDNIFQKFPQNPSINQIQTTDKIRSNGTVTE